MKYKLEHSIVELVNVHELEDCEGKTCPIHRKTGHSMRSYPQLWRDDRGIIERVCLHGVGHPGPDHDWPVNSYEGIHGCDGCCRLST